ncbi:hypothetical protein L0U85_15020 [Glycomyces sp. L485]|nr:hypothetical protein [Glycomyces sp. L485]MCH7232158.1 hypothetical protein [Glycomyces sp. L485]
MPDKEQTPGEEELAKAEEDVEGHGIEDEDEGDADVLDVNFGCNKLQ